MAKPTSNLRLFVGIYPPREVVEAMTAATAALDLPPHRTTPIEQVHLTVQFIGDTPAAALDATIESVERVVAGLKAFSLAPQRLVSLPQRDTARLIAVELAAQATLLEIHQRLVVRLARKVRDKDKQRFLPHITLCRFRSPARGVKVDEPLTLDSFEVTRIALMRSTLSADGAQHHEVMAWALA